MPNIVVIIILCIFIIVIIIILSFHCVQGWLWTYRDSWSQRDQTVRWRTQRAKGLCTEVLYSGSNTLTLLVVVISTSLIPENDKGQSILSWQVKNNWPKNTVAYTVLLLRKIALLLCQILYLKELQWIRGLFLTTSNMFRVNEEHDLLVLYMCFKYWIKKSCAIRYSSLNLLHPSPYFLSICPCPYFRENQVELERKAVLDLLWVCAD